MGVNPFKVSDSSFDKQPQALVPDGNPDPQKWNLLHKDKIGRYLLVIVEYPSCRNYEGKKILVFSGVEWEDVLAINEMQIDPHFSENSTRISPIARFAPTGEGWSMACTFATAMAKID